MFNEEKNLNSTSHNSEDEIKESKKRKRESEDEEEEEGEEEEDCSSHSDDEDEDDDEINEETEEESECDSNVEGTDSDDQSESEEEESDCESNGQFSSTGAVGISKTLSKNVDSDSGSCEMDSRDVCAICLSYMKGEIGSPELCDHSFCLECILEWAKSNNSCPQDRTQFLQVFVRKKVKGKIIRTITIEEVKPDDIPADDDEEPTFCEVCGRCDHEDTLLLCDGCDSGHHLECLSPPLSFVPIEEWFCQQCRPQNRRASQREQVEGKEVTSLTNEANSESCPHPIQRRLPRTQATERVRRRITRVRILQEQEEFSSTDDQSEDITFDSGLDNDVSTSSQKTQAKSSTKKKVTIRKKRKVIKRKRKIKRKTTRGKKTKGKKKAGTKKRGKKRTTKKKGVRRRKTTTKKRRKVSRKKKGKQKPAPQAIITPKARLAEALGIRPMKNPWQLSLPAMTGGRSQEGASLTNQRWRAGVPSLSLLGSNSELDYISEPDEFGDAILAAGVGRRLPTSTATHAQRKALAAEVFQFRAGSSLNSQVSDLPISDSNVSSVGDILDTIIQNQSALHKQPKSNGKVPVNKGDCASLPEGKMEHLAKHAGGGSNDSPPREGTHDSPDGQASSTNPSNAQPLYSSNSSRSPSSTDAYGVAGGGFSFGRNPGIEDPTGAKAYSTYLREQSHSEDTGIPESSSGRENKNKEKKEEKKKSSTVEEDDIDLYSDIEPEIPEGNEDEDSEDEEKGEPEPSHETQDQNDDNDSPLSGDELFIDDTARHEKAASVTAPVNVSGSTNSENEVGSSNLPGLNDFELEAVSDTDTHEMDKSINSSISFSDSNMGDPEVTSSTNDLNLNEPECKGPPQRVVQMYSRPMQSRMFSAVNPPIGMGLEGLETETISDNEEICFEDTYGNEDDNIEEGEIPSDHPPCALPANRPKINIQLRRVIEVSSPNKEFDGECEEGEIIDESAAKKEKKREKAKREVDEVVNAQSDEPKENDDKENANPDIAIVAAAVLSEPDLSSPEKLMTTPDNLLAKLKDKRKEDITKDKDKEKEKSKDGKQKEKDISFKKVSRNTKVRNYRDNDKESRSKRRAWSRERSLSRERGHSRDRAHSKERRKGERPRDGVHNPDRYRSHSGRARERERERDKKKEPKRKEMERYSVRQMITKKEEERKKKDEFGRDVSLRGARPSRSRSRSKGRGRRRSDSRSKKKADTIRGRSGHARKSFSRSRSKSRNLGGRARRRRRSYSSSSSSSTSSSSSSTTSSSSYTSSTSSSRSRSRSRSRLRRSRERTRRTKSRSRSLVKKKVEKKKPPQPPTKPKEKPKKAAAIPQKKKEEKRKEKRKEKDDAKADKQPKKKKKRDKTPLQSKEVYQAGNSIMVSVNFSRSGAKENKDPKKKKKDDSAKIDDPKKKSKKQPDKPSGADSSFHTGWSPRVQSVSPGGKHTPLQDEPMWSPDHLHRIVRPPETVKSPEVIDLDVIMVTPPPQEPILISDSEDDEGITRLPPDLGAQQLSPLSRNQGPKTPPEPGVKFTLSMKQILKPITNPLRDEEEEDHSAPVPSRGPNTPPGPPPESDESVGRPKSPCRRMPHSPVGTPPASSPEPDVYDPFEPTKSPSPPVRSPQQEPRVSSSDQTDQNVIKSPTDSAAPSKTVPSPPPPPLPADPPQSEERPPEPQKPPEDEASTTAPVPASASITIPTSAPTPAPLPAVPVNQVVTPVPVVVPLSSATHTLPPISNATNTQSLNTMQQIFAGLPANVANILYPAALAAAAMRSAPNTLLRPPVSQPMVPPDFSRPPPTAGILNRPPPTNISPMKADKGKVTQNGQNLIDVIDMDLGSPTSPDSSDVSDIFEPPSPHTTSLNEKTSPRKQRPTGNQKPSPAKATKHLDKFDALFGSSVVEPRSLKTSHKNKMSIASKLAKLKGGKKTEADDDIPNSAVDLQMKEKLLKKVQRQERVVDEVKLCLKPFYNKKTISKDDYKDIMKKCVQKVCHNRSGEINPNKIRGLVEGYIKKVKYYRKKMGGGTTSIGILSQMKGPVLPPTANDPPPPSFGLLSKTHLKLKP